MYVCDPMGQPASLVFIIKVPYYSDFAQFLPHFLFMRVLPSCEGKGASRGRWGAACSKKGNLIDLCGDLALLAWPKIEHYSHNYDRLKVKFSRIFRI